MRKMICLLLTVAVIMSLTATVFGIDAESTTEMSKTTIKEGGYTFEISEMVDSNYSIIRTYNAEASAQYETSECDAVERIKAVLTALGLDEEDIALLSSDDIEEYAVCEYITCETAYYKTDGETGVTAQIDEMTALSESAAVNEARSGNVEGNSYSVNNEAASKTDDYMTIRHLAAYKGDGTYKFTTSAEWKTMPFFRWTDAIGSIAQNISVDYSTRSATYGYYNKTDDGTYYVSGSLTSFSNVRDGNWYGSGVTFKIPSDTSSEEVINYRVNFSFNGLVNYPEQKCNFNSVGSYDHSTVKAVFSGISISLSAGVLSASISLDGVGLSEIRGAELLIKYDPND